MTKQKSKVDQGTYEHEDEKEFQIPKSQQANTDGIEQRGKSARIAKSTPVYFDGDDDDEEPNVSDEYYETGSSDGDSSTDPAVKASTPNTPRKSLLRNVINFFSSTSPGKEVLRQVEPIISEGFEPIDFEEVEPAIIEVAEPATLKAGCQDTEANGQDGKGATTAEVIQQVKEAEVAEEGNVESNTQTEPTLNPTMETTQEDTPAEVAERDNEVVEDKVRDPVRALPQMDLFLEPFKVGNGNYDNRDQEYTQLHKLYCEMAKKFEFATAQVGELKTALNIEKSMSQHIVENYDVKQEVFDTYRKKKAQQMREATKKRTKREAKAAKVLVPTQQGASISNKVEVVHSDDMVHALIQNPSPGQWTKIMSRKDKIVLKTSQDNKRRDYITPHEPIKYKKTHVEWIRAKSEKSGDRKDEIIAAKKLIRERLEIENVVAEFSFVGKSILEIYYKERDEERVVSALRGCKELVIIENFKFMFNKYGNQDEDAVAKFIVGRLGFLAARNFHSKSICSCIMSGYTKDVTKPAMIRAHKLYTLWMREKNGTRSSQ